jgi:hypothetical protein
MPRPKTITLAAKAELLGDRTRQKRTEARGAWRRTQKALAERRKQKSSNGVLAEAYGDRARLQVCTSDAGHYLGTKGSRGDPNSRESTQYWPKRWQARAALQGRRRWTQRLHL